MSSTASIRPSSTYNIHPKSHPLASLPGREYDLVVLGSGPAGRTIAARASKHGGLSVLLVEDELVGGECHFWACVPSKAMLRPAEAIHSALNVGGAKELIPQGKIVDLPGTWARRDKYADDWVDDPIVKMLEGAKIVIVRAHGRIAGVKKVLLESTSFKDEAPVEVTARHAVAVATGSDPFLPPIHGLAEARPWTSRDATSSRHVPRHLIVLGAGAVGTEMATAYNAYGAHVTLISGSASLLPRLEPEAGKRVRASLVARGVDVLLSTRATAVSRDAHGGGSGVVTLTLHNGAVVTADELLVATGRIPRTGDLGLETIGLDAFKGAALPVDETMRVTKTSGGGEWLYAIGDANGRALTTHMGKYQGRVAADVIIARAKGALLPPTSGMELPPFGSKHAATADRTAISQVVFTDPHVASVGLTLAEAKKAGKDVREVATPFKASGAPLHEDGYAGWAQWVVDVRTNQLVGATFVGRDAADLLHASTVAVVGGVPLDRLWHAVPCFPTLSEVYLDLLEAAGL